ncbi:MAG TPA: efflux RND transporter permease subunit [Phycisphaerae bacterium]|nr:efflux RND transporter permease subunit [Phycisphaerae bacterium]
MILSDTAIRRPVLTTMVIGAIIVFGVVSFRRIGIDLFPRVEFPVITILTELRGADPITIETTVTDPIEQAVSTISAIKHLRSTSAEGFSQVVIEFELEKNVDVAYQEVQAKLGTVRSELPTDIEEPIIEKFDIDAAPIMSVVVSGDMPMGRLTHLADKTVKERLQRIRNVGQVKLVGGRDREIWLWLDRDKLEGHQLAVQDVIDALRTEHVEYPGGRVETGPLEYVVKTKAEFESAEQFAAMTVAFREGAAIRVRDLGRVEDGIQEERTLAQLNERRAVALQVRRQSGTNTVEVADAVTAEVHRLQQELAPRGIKLEIAQDLSRFIKESVHEVQFHLVFGGGLAVMIVFLFLRNLRSTFISSLVIPTCIIGTFVLMNVMGFTQNMMTLLALSLAIGLLIDDSIVVQENTMRHVEEGKPAPQAASFATNEIALAVLATTASVVAVFVPVAFMSGIVGRFFYQFGLTVTFAVLISLLVAFTLDPMLSSRLLRKPRQGRLWQASERVLSSIDRAYEWLLARALRHRLIVVAAAIGVFIGTGFLARYLRSEFIPLEDQSQFNIRVKAPLGSSVQATAGIFEQIRSRLAGQSWLDYTFTAIGADELQRANEGMMYVKLLDKKERRVTQQDAMAWARRQTADIQNAKISIEIVPEISGGGMRQTDMQVELRGTDLDVLDAMAARVLDKMRTSPGYVDLDTTYDKNKPEVNVYVKRDRAADLGVNPRAIASTVRAMIGGDRISKFKAEGDRYDVSVRLEEPYRNRPEDIERLTVRSNTGKLVNLRNVAWVKQEAGPVQINRYNRTRQITVLANLDRDRKVLGEAVDELKQVITDMGLPPGYTFAFVGLGDVMQESFGYLFFALYLAVILIYMVLAAQFESFIHPFTIMLSVPLSIVGALAALIATGMTLSIFTMIGIIMLMGLVTKNGILLVDFTNTLRRRDGLERNAALLKAGPIRLRPILMTTFAMIFGMSPIALFGSESRSPMAVTVIGGLTTSTLLTLVVVPVVYTLLDDLVHPQTWRIVQRLRRRSALEPLTSK